MKPSAQKIPTANPMRAIKVAKVTLNMGCGTKLKVDDAKTILEKLSQRKIVITKTKKRTTFNVPKNKPIGAKVTIRKGCDEFLRRLLEARDMKLPESCFDTSGNFSFGIKEYIEVPGMEYEPKIGILGFDVCVTLERPGYRIKKKKNPKKLGKPHVIKKENAIEFVRRNFGIEIE